MSIERLEEIAQEICEIFEIYAPPVPIELMLKKPRDGMWEEVDPSQLSGSFLKLTDRFSPRMSLARLLVRHLLECEWGTEHDVKELLVDGDTVTAFARMLLMPRDMVMGLTSSMRNPAMMSTHFEVPEEDAQARLNDMY